MKKEPTVLRDFIVEEMQQRINELEADNGLLRDQNSRLDADLAVLETQLADMKALADSEGSRAVEYQRKARLLRAQLAREQDKP